MAYHRLLVCTSPGVAQRGPFFFLTKKTNLTRFNGLVQVNMYQPHWGRNTCFTCVAGVETLDEGLSACLPCAPGHYKRDEDTRCQPAPPGTYVADEEAIDFTPCPAGTFNNATAAEACEPCQPGYYSNTQRSTSCRVRMFVESASVYQAASARAFACQWPSYACHISPCSAGLPSGHILKRTGQRVSTLRCRIFCCSRKRDLCPMQARLLLQRSKVQRMCAVP